MHHDAKQQQPHSQHTPTVCEQCGDTIPADSAWTIIAGEHVCLRCHEGTPRSTNEQVLEWEEMLDQMRWVYPNALIVTYLSTLYASMSNPKTFFQKLSGEGSYAHLIIYSAICLSIPLIALYSAQLISGHVYDFAMYGTDAESFHNKYILVLFLALPIGIFLSYFWAYMAYVLT
ncbi:MAG: hypothetical protein AAFS10_01065, partial [Myxococcota bacterium]